MDRLRDRYVTFVLAEIANLEIDRIASNKVDVADAINSQCLGAVSYTHLTLPTTPYV